MFCGIEHIAIASPDTKRLAEWYVSALQFALVLEDNGTYFVQSRNGSLIEIIRSEGERPLAETRTPGMRHIAIAVENFDDAYHHLQSQNIRFLGEPYEAQGNRLIFFSDPDGNILHLIQRRKPLPKSGSSLQ